MIVDIFNTDKKYSVIYADPPWSYYNDVDAPPDVTTTVGMRRPPYYVLGSNTIKNLPVEKIAEDDAILFLWVTDYHLVKGLEIMSVWGFEYKTIGFVWAKKNLDRSSVVFTGAYTMKSGVELCLLGTKGKNAKKLVINHKVRSLVESIREEHSKKPVEVLWRIVNLVGTKVNKIELFAREQYKGWDCWGNEIRKKGSRLIDWYELKLEEA